ncbi:MAG: DNA mismatch repair endonuclease MutL [Lachnospiraceae bacterium]|nr:DNA mismatch repair endonuclease MutL [Lachnospiraceae bacterium]
MSKIQLLDKTTIEQIAAGEVVERPFNVVKELVENSIDAGAKNITVEIKDGGLKMIRVTDDGEGIPADDIPRAFLPHATSKIVDINDLLSIRSLGFRGEALSSISAVSEIELITKTKEDLLGSRYIREGDNEESIEKIGAPDGTTMIVKDLFYNVPARKKFLKSLSAEGTMVADLIDHIALSHPEIGFRLISNQKPLLQTSGNGVLKEVIYRIYGKETADNLIDLDFDDEILKGHGYIGNPSLTRSSRNFENFFMNGRFVHCDIFTRAVEEGYREFLMQHKFPFCVINFECDPAMIDVNVHPSKMEIRLHKREESYDLIREAVHDCMSNRDLIRTVPFDDKDTEVIAAQKPPVPEKKSPEPFESNRILQFKHVDVDAEESNIIKAKEVAVVRDLSQMNLFEDRFLSEKAQIKHRVIGQVFKTYWLFEYEDKLFMMDQHAAHEKVKYERLMKQYRNKNVTSQSLNPPIIVDLSSKEMSVINEYMDSFAKLGIEIEDFGTGSVALRSMPQDLYGTDELTFFREIVDDLMSDPLKGDPEVILSKIASMSCKAAVKGNTFMNEEQVGALISELMTLDNPYNCPHGRPTIISMTKNELDKKFSRIVT